MLQSIGGAEQRLGALGHPGEHRQNHQRQVGHHPVGRHRRIPCQAQQQSVEQDDHNAAGKLGDQGGKAQRKYLPGHLPGQFGPGGTEAVFVPEKVEGEDAQADDGGQAGGEHRPEHPHAQGEDEQVVQHHIG